MKYKDFRGHEIKRSKPKSYKQASSYRQHLERDFQHRCGYCNYSDRYSMVPFEIDHFIPKASFKNLNDALMTKYENLMYSCEKCNNAKGNQFAGDVFSPTCSNDLFYDPTRMDYNLVFYRDENGIIASDDEKGRDMIVRLRLYRTIHILAWLCEELEAKKDELKIKYECEANPVKREQLHRVYISILEYYSEFRDTFNASYRNERIDRESVIEMVRRIEGNDSDNEDNRTHDSKQK